MPDSPMLRRSPRHHFKFAGFEFAGEAPQALYFEWRDAWLERVYS